MRLAWFRPAAHSIDDTADLLDELGRDHHIDRFDQHRAHDFVWMHARGAYDLCAYELSSTPAHEFIWPYLFHFPGLLRLRSAWLHQSRTTLLTATDREREHANELAFGRGDLLRAPLLASRLVAIADRRLASRLQEAHPRALIRHVPLGAWTDAGTPAEHQRAAGSSVRFGTIGNERRGVLERAVSRARAAGATAEVAAGDSVYEILANADVIVALEWPPSGEIPVSALAGMAHRKPVIVLETEATACWPAVNPQTWQPRHMERPDAPAVVALDPRDEEHSLVLAVRRLASDGAMRRELAAAGEAWWRRHATLQHAVDAWSAVLEEAARISPPPHPAGWPPHLQSDRTAHTRTVLRDFAVSVDFLEYPHP